MRSTKPCNKRPCSVIFNVPGGYGGAANQYCIKPDEKYILISECMNACLPEDSESEFTWYTGGPEYCRTTNHWEANIYEDFKCTCKKRCPPPSGPYV